MKVEDASAYHANDTILLRKEFGEETHTIAAVSGNVLTLELPTGFQLQAMPANRPESTFTTFSVERDRPKVQRWNAVGQPIPPDDGDSTVSAAIELSSGVSVRFGGFEMRKGDHWSFKKGPLAGDPASGFDSASCSEELDFARPHGVVHHYAPLALIVRDPSSRHPEWIGVVKDRRRQIHRPVSSVFSVPAIDVRSAQVYAGGAPLPAWSRDSQFLVSLWGNATRHNPTSNAFLDVRVFFFDDDMTNPANPDTGKVFERRVRVPLTKGPNVTEDFWASLNGTTPDSPSAQPRSAPSSATSVHLFLQLSPAGGGPLVPDVVVGDVQLSITELQRSF